MRFSIQVRDSAPVSNIVEGGLDYFYITEGTTSVDEDYFQSSALKVYPNPFNEGTSLEFRTNSTNLPAELQVTDITGRIISTFAINTITGLIQIGEHWNPGIYFATLSTERSKTVRFIKTEK